MVIKNAYIVTMDDEKIIQSGYIVTEGSKISYVGEELPVGIEADKIIDAKGGIVMPGFVNSHTHSPMSIMRGYADDIPLHSWLCDNIFPAEEKLDDDALYYGSLLSYAEMIKGGTIAFADMYFTTENSVKAAIDCGIKANIAHCITGFGEEHIKMLTKAREIFKTYHNAADGKIKIDYSVHAVYTCGKKTLYDVAQTAAYDKVGISVHVSETEKENEDAMCEYKMTPTEILYEAGVLGENAIAAHGVHLSDSDMDILARTKTVVSHNPTSNLKLASGVADVCKMLDKGICISLGTDGAASNNALDMFAETKLCALLAKGKNMNAQSVTAKEALSAAISGGARAILRQNETGKIKEGFDADFIILDADSPNLCPVYEPYSALVYSASKGDVLTTVIGGKIVMENRELLTIDMEKVKREIKKSIERIGL